MDRKILIAAVIVAAALCIAAAAVAMNGDDDDNGSSTPSSDNSSPLTPGSGTSGHRVLVAYFSASGNTERIAQSIATATGGTLFEVTPTNPYTSADLNWNNASSRVNQEHDDASLRDIALVSTTPDDWSSYDVVFIGYPIWWGGAAWPVDGFVTGNDFTGKTVIPFCTSSVSPIGSSGTDLQSMSNGGTWLGGQRFSGSASADAVSQWVEGLNLG